MRCVCVLAKAGCRRGSARAGATRGTGSPSRIGTCSVYLREFPIGAGSICRSFIDHRTGTDPKHSDARKLPSTRRASSASPRTACALDGARPCRCQATFDTVPVDPPTPAVCLHILAATGAADRPHINGAPHPRRRWGRTGEALAHPSVVLAHQTAGPATAPQGTSGSRIRSRWIHVCRLACGRPSS